MSPGGRLVRPLGIRRIDMAEFMYVFRGGAPQGSPQEIQDHMQRWIAWMKQLADSGHLKNRGAPLERRTGRVVTATRVTDGPYAEKDVVAGALTIEADDFAQAVALTAGCPIFRAAGLIEVREVLAMARTGV
jgi:hypothetical protein